MAKDGWLELESDPGVFTLLAQALGVKGVQVEEIYDLSKELTDRVYGFIFLFCWSDDRRSRRRQSNITEDMQIRDSERLQRMFFARQVVTNSCATHALMSVVLNSADVQLGQALADFKDATRGMDADLKGLAISNVPEFADAHNRHARPEPISIVRTEANGPVVSRSVEAYHYISFVPIHGRLVELDGLKPHPVDHGPIPAGEDWTVRFRHVLQERLTNSFGDNNQDIRYNLLAVVDDRIDMCQRRLQALETQREGLLTTVEKTFCSLVASPVMSPEVPSTPVKESSMARCLSVADTPSSSGRAPSIVEAATRAASDVNKERDQLSAAATSEGASTDVKRDVAGLDMPISPAAPTTASSTSAAIQTQSIASTALGLHTTGSTTAEPRAAASGCSAGVSGHAAKDTTSPAGNADHQAQGTASSDLGRLALDTAEQAAATLAAEPASQEVRPASVFAPPVAPSLAAVLDAEAVSAALRSSIDSNSSIHSDVEVFVPTYANSIVAPGLAALAAVAAPSPLPTSPTRDLSTAEASDACPLTRRGAAAARVRYSESNLMPRVSVTCSSPPHTSYGLSLHADDSSGTLHEQQQLESDSEEGDVLKSSFVALATSLNAYSGDNTVSGGAAGAAASTSGAATPGLPVDDTRSRDVVKAAHVLVNTLRCRSNPRVTEKIPEATAMLEDAVAPLRRDDPDAHVRVQDIFKQLAEIDSEKESCQKHLNEEENKRRRYHVDHSRRTHDYGPFISTFLVMMAKEGLLQKAIETEHPGRLLKQRASSSSLPSAGGHGSSTGRGKKKASAASPNAAAPKRAKPGRPPGSKGKKKSAAAKAGPPSAPVRQADDSDPL